MWSVLSVLNRNANFWLKSTSFSNYPTRDVHVQIADRELICLLFADRTKRLDRKPRAETLAVEDVAAGHAAHSVEEFVAADAALRAFVIESDE
jgi:hypothetical protein